MMQLAKDILRGTGLALLAGVVCGLLSRQAAGRLFDLPLLLAVAMMAMLLTAWLIHLKSDGFYRGKGKELLSAPRKAGADRLQASFHDEPYERSTSDGQGGTVWSSLEVVRALLWGSVELGLASVTLHRWVGTGSHLP
jgi:hypothetical protein